DSALQQLVTQHARALGKQLAYRVRVRNFEAVCGMVAHGIGVGIVPQTAAARCARSMKIARANLSDAWAERTLMACVRSSEALPLNARRMLEHLLAPPGKAAAK
ncbi:MAG: LysR family transcriptional regulator, partial [Burkholderiales bacterium]|nr:LysR family transcriptional regulator [Burkholderiales bacterium]